MYGFESKGSTAPDASRGQPASQNDGQVSWSEVQRLIAKAHADRNAFLFNGIRRTLASWGSVFRRPGHILPRNSGQGQQPAH